MNLINGIRSYILDDPLKPTIVKNKINIVNYVDIGNFTSDKIIVKTNYKNIIIKGKDLVVSKLMNNEILITGQFDDIEFR